MEYLPIGIAQRSEVHVFSGVCLFVCQHDNFRTIKHSMLKLGGYMHCTKIWHKFECQGQRSRSLDTKNEKVQHIVWESSFGARSSWHFLGVILGAPKLVTQLCHPPLLCWRENQCMLSDLKRTIKALVCPKKKHQYRASEGRKLRSNCLIHIPRNCQYTGVYNHIH